ncbi:MAG: hypothetical protein WDN45_16935 [Caulobacteraceae bacterium]
MEGDLARHWQRSAQFLKLALDAWPRRLQALGLIDIAERRVRLLRLLERQWTDHLPATPLVAAGSTGTAARHRRPPGRGRPRAAGRRGPAGLDLELADKAWGAVGEQHPQGAMKRLLDRHGPDAAGRQSVAGGGPGRRGAGAAGAAA